MDKLKVAPLHDRVIIKPAPISENSSGGIIIPETAKEKPIKGEVVAVGNGKKDEPMTVKVGENVFYSKHAGSPIEVDGESYLIMRESDIICII